MFYDKIPELLKDLLRRASDRNSKIAALEKKSEYGNEKVSVQIDGDWVQIDAKELINSLKATNEKDKPEIEKLKEADLLLSKIAKNL